jgi:hypothetical protein
MAQETVDSKAARLTRTRPVQWGTATTVLVDGDRDRYLVRKRAEGTWSCMCAWGLYKMHVKHCSHVFATALMAPFVQEVA